MSAMSLLTAAEQQQNEDGATRHEPEGREIRDPREGSGILFEGRDCYPEEGSSLLEAAGQEVGFV